MAAGFGTGRLSSPDTAQNGVAAGTLVERPEVDELRERLAKLQSTLDATGGERERALAERAKLAEAVATLEKELEGYRSRPAAQAQEPDKGGESPVGLLDLPLEFLEKAWARQLNDPDPFLAKYYGRVDDPQFWKTEELIPEFEKEFGVDLPPREEEALSQVMEHHRKMAHMAFGNWEALRFLLVAERILEDDYLLPDESGNYPPMPKGSGVFSSYHLGKKRFLWTKEENPEYYRRWKVFNHAPLVMLEDIREFFSSNEP